MRKFLGRIFEAEADFEVATARDGVDALEKIAAFEPDVVTLDIEMPNMGGLECLDRIMIEHPCPVVMVSALTEQGANETLEALSMGAIDFIAKPAGTVSLHAEQLTPLILERVRSAARTPIRRSRRLADRLRFQSQSQPRRAVTGSRRRALTASVTPITDAIVLVGASTGGPPAIDSLLSKLPAEFGWPILIAQHMPESFTASFARRLNGICALDVIEVTGTTAIEPGRVYVGRGDADLIVGRRGDKLLAMAAPASLEHRWHPSVDRLVRSALECRPATELVGILMTGMGNDGAAAMAELRQSGGHTIAEAEDTAVVWGMPGELVKRGGADDVVSLPMIAKRLVELSPWR
jgi:two-component system chemotaxis response regulator CheB